MSCKYCDLKRRKDEDDDAEWIAGEDWESESEDGGYICPHNDGFRMLVYYDARCACTAVDNIKYCPFCGEELKAPKEPLIKDEKIRKAVRAWAEAENCTREMNLYYTLNRQEKYITFHNPQTGSELQLCEFDSPVFQEMREYTIAELCGEEEE